MSSQATNQFAHPRLRSLDKYALLLVPECPKRRVGKLTPPSAPVRACFFRHRFWLTNRSSVKPEIQTCLSHPNSHAVGKVRNTKNINSRILLMYICGMAWKPYTAFIQVGSEFHPIRKWSVNQNFRK